MYIDVMAMDKMPTIEIITEFMKGVCHNAFSKSMYTRITIIVIWEFIILLLPLLIESLK